MDGGGNNFDLLRLVAASAVIFSHSFGLITAGGHADADPLFRLTNGQMTFGELGVYIFFVTSGFLITPSLLRSRGLGDYFTKRLLRIIPGLTFVVLASILVFGPLLTKEPLSHYFGSTLTYRYLVNITMFVAQPGLPGVFASNPLPDMVNGSLWTLKFEFFCYVLLAGLSLCKLLSARVVLAGAVLCTLGGKLYAGPGYGYVFYAAFFLAGSALYLWRDHVRLNRSLLLCAVAAIAVSDLIGLLKFGFVVAGSYIVICAAYSGDLGERLRNRVGDYSYGLYLFGFPVEQTVEQILGASNTWWLEFSIAYPLALALAAISWNLVESPALRLRERLRVQRASRSLASQ